MEARFMTFEEMLKEERVERHSSTKNLDADHFPVKKHWKNLYRRCNENLFQINDQIESLEVSLLL